MAEQAVKLRCQRIGCNATFTEDDNPEGSCSFHDSPIFHDGMKKWSCCKKRSHDFSLFLEIPGCKTGKHTTEKPVSIKLAATKTIRTPSPVVTLSTSATSKESCARCSQGFFCSDHGSQPKAPNPTPAAPANCSADVEESPPPPKKIVDINQPQTCKNKGCGKVFKQIDNHETACSYHPGPAVFHDRVRGWKCCDIYVQEFDEFMTIPPCNNGWHNADPMP
ncbi:Cysteine and histidine-rich domain-containing protein RAR1 [Hibiscus syriacus]|uniref:Cysteine and histidine-rich domain-containing protein RAR1 n=1 Tax=Hibiscus syriacus TaxID=106335 RepID=A0A6A3A2Z8_HIBSY|nr:cysteine and histidine-rich domain-containing protein RAR1-like isoform X2 [Hibiscus syriacus]KAE8698196.1 Cysteine and histidine-rich domain-containing protein RAR1 [Hibiscus syriacus]